MTLEHLLVNNILGRGEPKNKPSPQKIRTAGETVYQYYVCARPHVHTERCAGACAFDDCFLQCATAFKELDSFQGHLHGSEKTFREMNYRGELKSLSWRKAKVGKSRPVCQYNAFL